VRLSARFTFTGVQFMHTEVYATPASDGGEGSSAQHVRPLPDGQHGLSLDLGQGHLWRHWLDPQGRIDHETLINAGNEINRTFSYGGAP